MQAPAESRPRTLRIRVHPEKCIGAGHCVAHAPDAFAQNDEDGVVILLAQTMSVDRREALEAAARLCPTAAIELLEVD